MDIRTCQFATTNIDGDPCTYNGSAFICRPTYANDGTCIHLCNLCVLKRTNNIPLASALFTPKPNTYLFLNLATNCVLPYLPTGFDSTWNLLAQHVKETVPAPSDEENLWICQKIKKLNPNLKNRKQKSKNQRKTLASTVTKSKANSNFQRKLCLTKLSIRPSTIQPIWRSYCRKQTIRRQLAQRITRSIP